MKYFDVNFKFAFLVKLPAAAMALEHVSSVLPGMSFQNELFKGTKSTIAAREEFLGCDWRPCQSEVSPGTIITLYNKKRVILAVILHHLSWLYTSSSQNKQTILS